MALENVDFQSFLQELNRHFAERLAGSGLPSDEVQENIEILAQFSNIALGEILKEPGISLPGTEQLIPWDEKTSTQGLTLFAEGIYMGMMKCFQLRIPSDVKKRLLQEFALDVYTQAKQVVASTYGQEHTPEFQLSHEQQVALINQSADSALMFYLNRYEQENGPIETTGTVPVGPLTLPETSSETVRQAAAASVMPAAPVRPQGPSPYDKYGAVALFLRMLPASQRSKVLRTFNEEEKELIAFYGEPKHIEQNLDIHCVAEHLKRLKSLFRSSGASKPSAKRSGALSKLAERYSADELLACVQDERPAVRQALTEACRLGSAHPLAPLMADADVEQPERLPSRIEEILCRHLQRRLEATSLGA